MRIRIHWGTTDPTIVPSRQSDALGSFGLGRRGSGGPGPLALGCSIAIHLLAVVALAHLDLRPDSTSLAKYRVTMVPLQSKRLIWYGLGDQLPEVSPPEPQPKQETLRAGRHTQTIVAAPRQPEKGNQFVWQPPPEIRSRLELKVPNVVALEMPKMDAPPPRAPLQPFTAPQARPEGPTPSVLLPEPPTIKAQANTPAHAPLPESSLEALPKPELRAFVPPADRQRAASGATMLEGPPPPGLGGRIGNPSVAIVSLQPEGSLSTLIPPGTLAAQVSAGSAREDRAGAGNPTARIAVPGLTISKGGQEAAPVRTQSAVPKPEKASEPTSTDWARVAAPRDSRAAARAMLSIGLRPGARVIPLAIDVRFSDRPVYTTSFELTTEAGRVTEWVIWFAELTADPGGNATLRPPVPWRRLETGGAHSAANDSPAGRVQLAGVIRKDGSIRLVSIIRGTDERSSQAGAELFQEWEFLPALKDGKPVEVEALIELTLEGARAAARVPLLSGEERR